MNPIYENYKHYSNLMYIFVKDNAKSYYDNYCNIMKEMFSNNLFILHIMIPKDYASYEYDSYDDKNIYFRKTTKAGKLSYSKDSERFDLPLSLIFDNNYIEKFRMAANKVLNEYNRGLEGPKE